MPEAELRLAHGLLSGGPVMKHSRNTMRVKGYRRGGPGSILDRIWQSPLLGARINLLIVRRQMPMDSRLFVDYLVEDCADLAKGIG